MENLHFETEKYKDHPVDYQPLTEKGRNYLKEGRKLPEWLIDYAEKEGLIAELKPKHERQNFLVRDDRLDHAVAFLWKDPQTKETVGASYQGTFIDYERFGERGTYKHIDKNSTANHGFNLKIGDPKQLKFFESSIDLLSYAALNRDQLNDTWLVSMESILKEVEGIGTEATRANIIEILKQKEYIKVEKNKLVVTNKGILLCQAVEKEPLLTSAEMTAKWESYLLKIGERKGTQTTFLANIQKFVSHLLEVVPGQIQSTDFGSTLQEVKAASEKQEAARHLGICPKCQEQEVILYQKVAACTSEVCDFKLWTTIAKKKLTATQLKEIIQNSRTSQPVKGLKGQKGSFEATIVLKEDFTTGFEFSEKKKTNFKKRTRLTTK